MSCSTASSAWSSVAALARCCSTASTNSCAIRCPWCASGKAACRSTAASSALFARKTSRTFLAVTDFTAPLAPIGLGLGRLGNFINAELPGRVTDSSLGVHFPCASVRGLNLTCFADYEDVARHVSSLYQALAEGVVLFALVWLFAARPRSAGQVSGAFLLGYGVLRFLTEFVREPDPHKGFVAFDWVTMGQLLSVPMVLAGIALLVWSMRGAKA